MSQSITEQVRCLAEELEGSFAEVRCEITAFDSGAAMLEVRNREGRCYLLSYSVTHGFGVDEVLATDEWGTGYAFTSFDFASAAAHLRQLVTKGSSAVGLELLVIYVADIDRSKQFYDVIGLSFSEEKHGNGPRHYAAQIGSSVFELYPASKGDEGSKVRLGFRVPSIESKLQALQATGGQVVSPLRHSSVGRRAVVADPDGHRVELMELTASI